MPVHSTPLTQCESYHERKSQVRQGHYNPNVDFDRLAEHDADFAAFYTPDPSEHDPSEQKPRRRLDFCNPKAVQQLTKSVLKLEFGIEINLPDDRLCPPVAVRWNYIDWIERLLNSTSAAHPHDDIEHQVETRDSHEVIGFDIGVGASCIYGLLACATYPSWRMFGTDIDAESLASARNNVRANHLDSRIVLAQTAPEDSLLSSGHFGVDRWDFVMTNPPFYASQDEMTASYESKTLPPSAICTGSANEMICPGGDLGFVTRILDESLILRDRIQWYTAMLGKLGSLQAIVAKLKLHGIDNYAVTSLHAGNRTKRWAIAWSFCDRRPRNDIARHADIASNLLPLATATTIAVPLMSASWAGARVDEIVRSLDVQWTWDAQTMTGLAEATKNVWSRAARRKRKFQDLNAEDDTTQTHQDLKIALGMQIVCEEEQVTVHWVVGLDQMLYQSFCGMLKRSLTMTTAAPPPNETTTNKHP